MSKPQRDHTLRIVGAFIVSEGVKTLSHLNRQGLVPQDLYAVADFFTSSSWQAEAVRQALLRFLVHQAIESAQHSSAVGPPVLDLSLDDAMSAKSRTSKHFQPGAWYRHKKGERHYYQHGVAFLSCRMQGGAHAFTVHWRWYLRERTVRRVNRTRPPEKRLKFRSKGSLARIMLQELHTLLAPEITSSVQFASWYAAATWIQCCRRHGWHVSCALKSHRKFNGKPLYSIAPRYLRQRKAPEVTITYSTTSGT